MHDLYRDIPDLKEIKDDNWDNWHARKIHR